MKKIIISILVAGLVIGSIVAYNLYNEEHLNVSEAPTDIKVSVLDLVKAFSEKEKTAHANYNNKIVELSLSEPHFNIKMLDSVSYVMSLPGNDSMSVSITLDKEQADKAQNTPPSIVKCLYSGFLPYDKDFEVPGEIKFLNGAIIK